MKGKRGGKNRRGKEEGKRGGKKGGGKGEIKREGRGGGGENGGGVYICVCECIEVLRMKKGCSGIAIVSLPQSQSKVRHALRGYTL